MEEVTRFMLLRPASLVDFAQTTIPVRPRESVIRAIHAGRGKAESGKWLRSNVGAQREQLGFASWDALPLAGALARWGAEVTSAADDTVAAALASAASVLGQAPTTLVGGDTLTRTRDGLSDWVACDKHRGHADEQSEPAQRALKAVFLLELLVRHPGQVGSPKAVMDRTLLIDVPRSPRTVTPPRPTRPREPDPRTVRATLDRNLAAHRAAIAEIDAAPAYLVRTAEATGTGRTSPTAPDPAEDEAGAPARRPRISQELVRTLTPETQAVLASRKVRVGIDDTTSAHARLLEGLRDLSRQQRAFEAKHGQASYVVRFGGALFEIETSSSQAEALADSLKNDVPTSHSHLQSVGVADLMVVRQQLVRYEASDLSYIENVLIGEKRSREHRESLSTQRVQVIETETTQEETRDLETSDRNELSREASDAMKDQLSMKFGTKVSGSYGPAVQFSVNADLGFDHSKEEAHKFASKVAKENTQRTSTKISQRFKQSLTVTTTSTTEENNIHAFDNSTRDQHVVGLYQWVDKVYQAQVFNYGLRALYDIVIPEPAALMLYVVAGQGPITLIKAPPKFDVTLDGIDEGNYTDLATKFGASGLEAWPEPVLVVSKVLEGMDEDVDRGVTHQTADLPIPEGYYADGASVAVDYWRNNIDDKHKAAVMILVNGHRIGLNDGKRTGSVDLENDCGSVSVAMHSFRTPSVVATVAVTCRRTPRSVEAWKLKVYTALKTASDMQHQDHDEKVARAKAEAADAAAGAKPLRRTESDIRNELKRQAISMFTQQSFASFDSIIDPGQGGLPEIDFPQAEADEPYIRFFEQAFEWEQMMHVFYPYYWGRTSRWKTRLLLDEPDPDFAEFLKAGAARLVIPVRENFVEAVAHFFETGQVWSGGPVPDVTSPEYVSIITEIKERTKAPGDEVPVGDAWEVRLPTQLVKLRNSPTLPTWQKGADGVYHPVGE